jgi:hypothetical protein
MNDDEGALLAETVAAGRLDVDAAQPLFPDLAFERLIDVCGIAGAASRVGAYADRYPAGRPLAENFPFESIEALERAELVEFQGRTLLPCISSKKDKLKLIRNSLRSQGI